MRDWRDLLPEHWREDAQLTLLKVDFVSTCTKQDFLICYRANIQNLLIQLLNSLIQQEIRNCNLISFRQLTVGKVHVDGTRNSAAPGDDV